MVLRRIGVLSAGKVLGVMYALFGLIVGLFFALFSVAGVAVNGQQAGNGALPFVGLGVGAVIILPIVYGIMGCLGGIIAAAIYNLVATIAGGVEFEFEQSATTFQAP